MLPDVLVSRHGDTLETLPVGARTGTRSHRRAAQLLYQRPDLQMVDIRGNVDTRIRKAMAPNGPYDAIIPAHAGLERLGHLDCISQVLLLEQMLPASGQGVLGIPCRDEASMLVDRQVEGVTFTSSSTVNNFLRRLESEGGTLDDLNSVCLVCIGPKTLRMAQEHGLRAEVMSVCHTLAWLVAELEAYFTVQENSDEP